MQLFVDWIASWRHRALLVFSAGELHGQISSQVHELQQDLFGLAELAMSKGRSYWRVDFWKTREGIVLGREYELRVDTLGALSLGHGDDDDEGRGQHMLAPDESRVVTVRAAVVREKWIPSTWEVCETHEALVNACQQARAATILLDYTDQDMLDRLTHTVFTLRKQSGPGLKIVIREVNAALRYQYESLLLKLGANIVVSQGTAFSRIMSMMDSVQGQVFARAILTKYDSAVSAAMITDRSGYLAPQVFLEFVQETVAKSRALKMSSVLLQLPLAAQVAHVDALRCCRLNRPGDVFTADANNILVFLFACRETDVDQVLERIFSQPVARLFESETRCVDEQSIKQGLLELEHEVHAGTIDDFSELFSDAARAAVASAPQKTADTVLPEVNIDVAVYPALQNFVESESPVLSTPTPPILREVRPYTLPLRTPS